MAELYLIFEGPDYARILWSKNLDDGDLPRRYPSHLEIESNPGVMDRMNVFKITHMQQSFRWQPYLPFMPFNIENHPWMEHYNYKYDNLPIVQAGNQWTLERTVAQRWDSHVQFFTHLISKWCGQLSFAPMSVDLPDIRQYEGFRFLNEEKKARGYFWDYRTLIFAMFAQFSMLISTRPNWIESCEALREQGPNSPPIDRSWYDAVNKVFGDFTHTKRVGVIVAADPQIWNNVKGYQTTGVPTLMHVGHVLFNDGQPTPSKPSIHIVTLDSADDKWYPQDWPRPFEILQQTRVYLHKYHRHRFGDYHLAPPPQLDVPRPLVEDFGEGFHQRPETTSWFDPQTGEPSAFIQCAPVLNTVKRSHSDTPGWVEFFDERNKANARRLEGETPRQKQARESRASNAEKLNKTCSSSPSNKSTVYQWVQVANPAGENLSMHDDWPPVWRRVKVDRKEVEDVWDDYTPTQRLYDPFRNEWDLHCLLDVVADAPDPNYEDSDDGMDVDANPTPVAPNQQVVYLDQVYGTVENPFINVNVLSSFISLVAPMNFDAWAYWMFGLSSSTPGTLAFKPVDLSKVISFRVTETVSSSLAYKLLEEYLSIVMEKKFDHPRLQQLSDLDPAHPNRLLFNRDIVIEHVTIDHTVPQLVSNAAPVIRQVQRYGYLLTPMNDSLFNASWKLLVFEATSVVHILRNGWGSSSMETLIRHLVCHGIEFSTLMPAINVLPDQVLNALSPPDKFKSMPYTQKKQLLASDFEEYRCLRDQIMVSHHAKAAFRMGGIIWRLVMEKEGGLDEIVESILDGPADMGSSRCEYFTINGQRFYDDGVPPLVADTICGSYRINGCERFFFLVYLFF